MAALAVQGKVMAVAAEQAVQLGIIATGRPMEAMAIATTSIEAAQDKEEQQENLAKAQVGCILMAEPPLNA